MPNGGVVILVIGAILIVYGRATRGARSSSVRAAFLEGVAPLIPAGERVLVAVPTVVHAPPGRGLLRKQYRGPAYGIAVTDSWILIVERSSMSGGLGRNSELLPRASSQATWTPRAVRWFSGWFGVLAIRSSESTYECAISEDTPELNALLEALNVKA
jgi:hypothetical protein